MSAPHVRTLSHTNGAARVSLAESKTIVRAKQTEVDVTAASATAGVEMGVDTEAADDESKI